MRAKKSTPTLLWIWTPGHKHACHNIACQSIGVKITEEEVISLGGASVSLFFTTFDVNGMFIHLDGY